MASQTLYQKRGDLSGPEHIYPGMKETDDSSPDVWADQSSCPYKRPF